MKSKRICGCYRMWTGGLCETTPRPAPRTTTALLRRIRIIGNVSCDNDRIEIIEDVNNDNEIDIDEMDNVIDNEVDCEIDDDVNN